MCSSDLHPEAILQPGLGELQDTDEKRIQSWAKGYTRGACDLLILNKHRKWTGLAIEFKTPANTGVLSPDQRKYLDNLERQGWKTIVSNDYTLLIVEIQEYFRDLKVYCKQCDK